MQDRDNAYLREIRGRTLTRMAEVIGSDKDVAIVDMPNQRNVGDALIWAGELEYLSRLNLRIRYMSDMHGLLPTSLRRVMRSGVILIHGGGNFGDLWVGHQRAREQVVAEFVDYPIVQLPQTLFFQDPDEAERANHLLSSHPSFHAMLRDEPSLARAKEQLRDVSVSYCEDMALGWAAPSKKRRGAASRSAGVLIIGREDKESSSGLAEVGTSWIGGHTCVRTDWHNSGLESVEWHALQRLYTVARRLSINGRVARSSFGALVNTVVTVLLRRINEVNIRGGVKLMSGSKIAVVDRLHAHVMAALLDLDHVVLDNNYGKVKSIYDGYSGNFSTAHFAQTVPDAKVIVEQVLATSGTGQPR